MAEVQVEVVDDTIIVTTPGYRVGFRKSPDSPSLTRSEFATDGAQAEITLHEFLVAAWRCANDKARKLGWIV